MFRKGENGEKSQKMGMQDYRVFLLQFFRPTAFACAVNLILFAFVPRPLKSKLGKAILKGEEHLSDVLQFLISNGFAEMPISNAKHVGTWYLNYICR